MLPLPAYACDPGLQNETKVRSQRFGNCRTDVRHGEWSEIGQPRHTSQDSTGESKKADPNRINPSFGLARRNTGSISAQPARDAQPLGHGRPVGAEDLKLDVSGPSSEGIISPSGRELR